MNFEQLATIITDTHRQLQQSAVKAVNQYQTVRNWLIGFYIVEFEQNGEDRAKYGEGLLKKTGTKSKPERNKCHIIQTFKNFLYGLPSVGNCN